MDGAIRTTYHISRFIGKLNLANRSVGIILIWLKACSCYAYNSYDTILTLFKFGRQTKIRQTAKLKSPPNTVYVTCTK